jgi:S-adenosylmethionine-diacylglycerol 3-amino-3-carboxypropyl transferase
MGRLGTDDSSEIAGSADFSLIRYAQCWEDADLLLQALAIQPGDTCLSVASGGENTLSLLTCRPGRVVAVDLSAAQLATLELKAAAFRTLTHPQALELVGIRPSADRLDLYAAARAVLSAAARRYWDARPGVIQQGVCGTGKFERYLSLFRRAVLPLVHSHRDVDALLLPRDYAGRRQFFDESWNTWRWRTALRIFCSRPVMGHLGRDPRFFKYVEGNVAGPIRARADRALTVLDPASNPYLHWMLRGQFGSSLPHAWRAENFAPICEHLDRLELREGSVESALGGMADHSVDRFNLSDVFEYMAEANAGAVFAHVARCGRPGGRVAYWNMAAPRRRPVGLAARLHTMEALSRELFERTTTFFYSAFYVDEIRDEAA